MGVASGPKVGYVSKYHRVANSPQARYRACVTPKETCRYPLLTPLGHKDTNDSTLVGRLRSSTLCRRSGIFSSYASARMWVIRLLMRGGIRLCGGIQI